MKPSEVILEVLDDRWSFEGDHLVFEDDEGCFTRAAQVTSKGESYPVRVEFLEDMLPDVTAQDEAALRAAFKGLSQLSRFRRVFTPP